MNLEEALLKTSLNNQWSRIGIRHHHGIDVPLFAIHSEKSCGIGEFYDLILLIDWCASIGMDVIQLLPLNDTGDDTSPFFAVSAMALNPLYLSLSQLEGVDESNLQELRQFNKQSRVPYHDIQSHKLLFLRHYFEEKGPSIPESKEYQDYVDQNKWLKSYALFKALKNVMAKNHWLTWPIELKTPTSSQFEELIQKHRQDVNFHIFLQFLCYKQLKAVREYANEKKIFLKGDIPILISPDSADVWEYHDEFDLSYSAGAPPDTYNEDGQVWGLPIFKWNMMQARNFDWWRRRLDYASYFYDIYRIDHVLGFFRIWAIPLGQPSTAGKFIPENHNHWLNHGKDILTILVNHSTMLPIAEDLGIVPDSVRAALSDMGICGTKVIRWEVTKGGEFIDLSEYNPISMTTVSTHDSQTLATWWLDDPKESQPYAEYKNWTWGSSLTQDQQKEILRDSHHSSSLFHINLLGEYLALFPELVWEDPHDERINIPGIVSPNNWSYKTRPTLEQIVNHGPLKEMIKEIIS